MNRKRRNRLVAAVLVLGPAGGLGQESGGHIFHRRLAEIRTGGGCNCPAQKLEQLVFSLRKEKPDLRLVFEHARHQEGEVADKIEIGVDCGRGSEHLVGDLLVKFSGKNGLL